MYDDEAPVSIGSWLITIVLFSVPVVNVIYLIALMTGHGNRSLVNFARAYGIIIGACLLVSIIITIACFGFVMAFADAFIAALQSVGIPLPF